MNKKLSYLIAINIFFAVFFGVAWAFFPHIASPVFQIAEKVDNFGWSGAILNVVLALFYTSFLFIHSEKYLIMNSYNQLYFFQK